MSNYGRLFSKYGPTPASFCLFFTVKLFLQQWFTDWAFNRDISASMTSCVRFLGLSQLTGGSPGCHRLPLDSTRRRGYHHHADNCQHDVPWLELRRFISRLDLQCWRQIVKMIEHRIWKITEILRVHCDRINFVVEIERGCEIIDDKIRRKTNSNYELNLRRCQGSNQQH